MQRKLPLSTARGFAAGVSTAWTGVATRVPVAAKTTAAMRAARVRSAFSWGPPVGLVVPLYALLNQKNPARLAGFWVAGPALFLGGGGRCGWAWGGRCSGHRRCCGRRGGRRGGRHDRRRL